MSVVPDPTTQQTINLARKLERLLYQRRSLNKKLARLDHEILTTRRFLGSLPPVGESAAPVDNALWPAKPAPGAKSRKRSRKKK